MFSWNFIMNMLESPVEPLKIKWLLALRFLGWGVLSSSQLLMIFLSNRDLTLFQDNTKTDLEGYFDIILVEGGYGRDSVYPVVIWDTYGFLWFSLDVIIGRGYSVKCFRYHLLVKLVVPILSIIRGVVSNLVRYLNHQLLVSFKAIFYCLGGFIRRG